MADSRETISPRRAFVCGHPIKHSRSPLIHGHWLKGFGIDGSYAATDIAPDRFPDFIDALRSGESGYVGGNVTLPHKEAACALADAPDDLAEELGAANTLWVEDGEVRATNTDVHGFAANLDARHPGWDRGERAIVFGAGGAARAVIRALRDRGFAQIHVVNRTVGRARELADRFGARVFAHPQPALAEVMTGADLFVNTAAVGMDGEGAPDIDFSPLSPGALVTDIVYVPLITPFLAKAGAQGFATVDGLGMLLHQAVPGFETWFGQRPVVDEALRAMIIADMDAHR